MTALKQWVGKNISLLPLLLGVFMLALATAGSASAATITPTCDGLGCKVGTNDCGSKCVCNSVEAICLDNT